MTFALWKQAIIDTHEQLIEQLEDKYKNHITKLLEQKKLLLIQLQKALCHQFMNIENISNQFTQSDLSSIDSTTTSNATLNTNQVPIFSLKDTNLIDSGNKFECNHCHKFLSSTQSLARHTKSHIEKPYKCNYCNYRSSRKDHLQRHIRIHTGEKPFKCEYCDKRFKQISNLKKHTRIHTGEKPFKCEYCDKRFTQNCHLNAHNMIHTGEKPYKCDDCDYRSRTKYSLTNHVRIHNQK